MWELAALLFDPIDPKTHADLPNDRIDGIEDRIRKNDVSRFWEKLCYSAARDAASTAPNAEERAIAYLSANKIADACDALTQGKDYRLAVLISQLGSDRITRDDMITQLQHWRELNVLSEMTEPIRALYELLTGSTCVCEGKRGPPEDRARTFVLSERFHFDWKRAFGLRLWYAILSEDPLEVAIQRFEAELKSGQEKKQPLPWFIEEKIARDWHDPEPSARRDILWGILQLYASSKAILEAPAIADLVAPHNVTGNPLNARLSFQLCQALALRFPQSDTSKSDQITWDFACQLESSGEWLWALFATLHLHDSDQRETAIQSLLAHHVSELNDADFQTLTTEFKIPTPWIWEAKALLSRSQEDSLGEVQHLLRAENWEEAHSVLCRTVGPRAIIEEDYQTLQDVLGGFEPDGKEHVESWEVGGQVYQDFVDLVQDSLEEEGDRMAVLKHLLSALPEMGDVEEMGFEEKVAVGEMSAVVGRKALEVEGKVCLSFVVRLGTSMRTDDEQGIQKANVLNLPMTDEMGLKSTVELGFGHYRAVMAGGR